MTWTGKNEILDETVAFDELVAMLEEAGAAYAVKRVPKDAMVFWHGEADGNHYYVESGAVELFSVDAAGRRKVIDRYGPGTFFGFHILRDTDLPMSTAQCIEASRVVAIPKESFFKLLHSYPHFADRTVRYLFGLLSMQTREVLSLSFYGAGQRVPMLLAELARERREAAREAAAADVQYDHVWELRREAREKRFDIMPEGAGVWRVRGVQVERMVVQTDWENEEAVAFFQHRFKRLGVDTALEKAGALDGDEVHILGYSFAFESPHGHGVDMYQELDL